MPTITDMAAERPVPPDDTLRVVLAALRAADPHIAVLVAVAADEPCTTGVYAIDLHGPCFYCDPAGSAAPGIAVVTWINRFARIVTRSVCRADLSVALTEGSSDGRDLTVHVPLTPGINPRVELTCGNGS